MLIWMMLWCVVLIVVVECSSVDSTVDIIAWMVDTDREGSCLLKDYTEPGDGWRGGMDGRLLLWWVISGLFAGSVVRCSVLTTAP